MPSRSHGAFFVILVALTACSPRADPAPSITRCDTCSIRLDQVTRIESTGRVPVDEVADIATGPSAYFVVFRSGIDEVVKYSRTGELLAVRSETGNGPGENGVIGALQMGFDGMLTMIDVQNRRFTKLSPDLDVVSTRSMTVRSAGADFLVFPSGQIVLPTRALDADGNAWGLVQLDSLTEASAFFRRISPDGRREWAVDLSMADTDSTYWVVGSTEHRVEKWRLGRGEPTRVWDQIPAWFTPLYEPQRVDERTLDPTEPPDPTAGVRGVWWDRRFDRLWIASSLPRPDWEAAFEQHRRPPADHVAFTAIEVYDENLELLGTRFVSAFPVTITRRGELVLYASDSMGEPHIDIYGLSYQRPS